ncbi:MAG: S9 family peptidase [Alphaproteobacteria bacterium]|nr:S9 family peptidase [Alphaproteobacteria bacterium]
MRGLTINVIALLSAGAAVAAGPPDRPLTDPHSLASITDPAATAPPIAALFEAKSAQGADWTPDGKAVVVSANVSGRFNLWWVPLDGAAPRQLLKSDDRQTGQTVSPDGRTVVFESDHGGGEYYDLYAAPLAGGEAVDLTNTPDISETGAVFAPDGKTLAFGRKVKGEPMSNVAVMDMATHAVRVLTHEADAHFTWRVVDFTPDGTGLIADRTNVLRTEGGVYRIDLTSGAATPIVAPQPGRFVAAEAVSPNGKLIAVSTDEGSEQPQAAVLELAGGETHRLAPSPWEQAPDSFSPDGRWLLFRQNVDGRTVLSLYDTRSRQVRPLVLPDGLNSGAGAGRTSFSPDSRKILIDHVSSAAPQDYWLYDLTSGALQRVTHLAPASLEAAHLPSSHLVHYASFDGTVISAFVWLPPNLKRDGTAPGVVLPHGGPTGQTLDGFNRTAEALASRGYVVIAPNPRGSTGYGRAFQAMNIKDLGGGDLQDEVYGARFLTATGYVDPRRIGITGGSYGGYMTLMAIGKTPTLWRAAVEEYGIIDWRTMLQHEDPSLQAYEKSLLGDPDQNPKVYADDSPITFIRDETAPLLVLQGDNDIRVPKEEAKQIVAILQGEGRTVDAHYYPAEGHGFFKIEDQIDALTRTVDWFDRYLKP